MPSRLGYYSTPQAKFYATQRANKLAPQQAKVNGPWGGYVPDLEPRQLDYRSCHDLYGLVVDGEVLTYDYGWQRYEGSAGRLPLGTNAVDVPQVGAAVTVPLPILGLAKWFRQEGVDRNLAIAGGTGTKTGLLFSYSDGAAAWVAVPPDASTIRILDTTEGIFDWCNYALAKGQGAGGGDPITGVFVFTNYNDVMHVYPYNNALNTYGGMPYPGPGTIQAKSCAVMGERLFVLNTVITFGATTTQPLELRWTESSWSQVAATIWSNVGSGALILKELKGIGLKVLPIADALAVYCSDGVVMAYRTGQATAPIQIEYLTKTRGLLGTRAVVDLGGGVHFGIFEDGWYFLDRNGQWTEAGTVTVEGRTLRKWATTFYQSLDFGLKDKIVLEYDELRGFIYIAWADRDAGSQPIDRNNRTWIYDIRGDRIFPERYEIGFPINQTALSMGVFTEVASGTLIWTAATFPWNHAMWLHPWLKFAAPSRTDRLVHGTSNGMVHEHSPNVYTRDGIGTSWSFLTHADPLGDHTVHKVVDRLWVEYIEQNTTILMGIIARSGDGHNTQARAFTLTNEFPSSIKNAVVSFRFPATHPILQISGFHPFQGRAFLAQYLPTETLNTTPHV